MDTIKQQFSKSVMSYITLSLVSIIAVALISIFISFWVTELADKDAQAINLSGSMRMHTYHIGLALQQGDIEQTKQYTQQLDNTWNHTLFVAQRLKNGDSALNRKFNDAYTHWNEVLHPKLLRVIDLTRPTSSLSFSLLEQHVTLTDAVVDAFQKDAERKIRQLRTFQLLALFATIVVGSVIFHLLKNRVEKPLGLLTEAAKNIGEGDIKQRVDISGNDELGLLGAIFNKMSDSIECNYQQLEKNVAARTEELNRKNITLEFLFSTAEKIINSQHNNLNYQNVIDQLAKVLNIDNLELCLFTPQGEKPYLHTAPENTPQKDCANTSCGDCKGQAPFSKLDAVRVSDRYPVNKDGHQYGVISLTTDINNPLDEWQEQLLRSCADQLAIALYLNSQKEQHRRIAMIDERTVIARELHDSLAQALSYLQIQVTRLQKSHDKEKWQLQQPIIDELREGLSSAYRQLRELLTTFRLKMDDDGLQGALKNTIKQLQERTDMAIKLDYQLANIPLSPTEEIHLLQIVREASQNSLNHAQGSRVDIALRQMTDKRIELTICDNGIGIKSNPEKLNHYGLAIMNERSRHLGGKVDIRPRAEGGTIVEFLFTPEFLNEKP